MRENNDNMSSIQFIKVFNSHSTVLNLVRSINQDSIKSITNFLQLQGLRTMAYDYGIHKGRNFDIGLNIFSLISNQYKKENFHSDILTEILNPTGKHGENDKFLKLFLNYLTTHSRRPSINKSNYLASVVERESQRIDISIKDVQSKHAIIIENKINNAGDMPRQIPRYWKKIESQGYTIDAVVYIVLTGNKQPNTSDWTQHEREIILDKTLAVCAYNETEADLYNGWLKKSESAASNIDTVFLFRQYNKLIYHLGGSNMNRPLMEEFLSNMLIKENYETANALKDMLEDLIIYRRDKIINTFKYEALPFTKVWDWTHYAVLGEYFKGEYSFKIDVIVTKNLYQVQFFEIIFHQKPDITGFTNPAISLLEEIGFQGDFFPSSRRMEKQFKFPEQENELYIFLRKFLEALKINDNNRILILDN